MTDRSDDKIYGLIAVAQDQQAAVRAGLEGLAQERAALATERVALAEAAERMQKISDGLVKAVMESMPRLVTSSADGMRQGLNDALAGVGEETTQRVALAAQPAIDNVAEVVRATAAARQQLSVDLRDFRRRWLLILGGSVAGALLIAGVLSYGFIWWQVREIQQLQAYRDQLAGEISGLQGQAELRRRGGGGAQRPAAK
jgi:hypothetical protein